MKYYSYITYVSRHIENPDPQKYRSPYTACKHISLWDRSFGIDPFLRKNKMYMEELILVIGIVLVAALMAAALFVYVRIFGENVFMAGLFASLFVWTYIWFVVCIADMEQQRVVDQIQSGESYIGTVYEIEAGDTTSVSYRLFPRKK
jgi:hypothetical protein